MKTINTYLFSDLPPEAKQTAINNNTDINTDHDWSDCIIDNYIELAALVGLDINNIYWSGFSSQGGGACFTGSYSYRKGAVKALEGFVFDDHPLIELAKQLQAIQKDYFYSLTSTIHHLGGNYYHEQSVKVITTIGDRHGARGLVTPTKQIGDLFRALMQHIYLELQTEYEFLTSDEQVAESLECNELYFFSNGQLVTAKMIFVD